MGSLAVVLPGAMEQAQAAVHIDGDDPWARLALGFVQMFRREQEEEVGSPFAWVDSASPLVSASDRARYCDVLRPVGLPER